MRQSNLYNGNSYIGKTASLYRDRAHVYPTVSTMDVNPLRAKFFRGNINIYVHFMSFLHINLTQVLKILPQSMRRTCIFYIVNIIAADVLAT